MVKEDILPLLREKFPGQVRIVEYDVMAKTENLNLLFAREKQVGSHGWESVSIFVNRNVALDGLAAIHERLEATVRQCLLQKGAAVPMPPLSTPAALVEKATK